MEFYLSPEWIIAIANIILAGVTFWATIVALKKDDWRKEKNKPIIEPILGNIEPFVVQGRPEINDIPFYFRIKVRNNGKTLLRGCQAKLLVVYSLEDARPIISDPISLKWASSPRDSRYVSDGFDKPVFREKIDIAPESWELCDFIKAKYHLPQINFLDIFGNSDAQGYLKSERKIDSLQEGKSVLAYVVFSGENIKPRFFPIVIERINGFKIIKLKVYK